MSVRQAEALERLLREGPLDLGGDVAVQRPLLEGLLTAHPLPADVTTTPSRLGGVEVVDIEVGEVGDARGVLLFLHGGAFVMGSAMGVAGMASELARRAGTRAVSVEYRLAPEHPHPAALQDALAAYRGLLASGVAPSEVVLGGESAGAGLALATLVAARDAGLPQPSCAVLLSPWLDLTLSGTSMAAKAPVDPALSAARLAVRVADYLDGADPADPSASPLFADLRGLAPLVVQVGSHEVLLDDALRLAGRAAAADVEVVLEVTPRVPHVFQGFAAVLDEAGEALGSAGAHLRRHLDRGRAPGA